MGSDFSRLRKRGFQRNFSKFSIIFPAAKQTVNKDTHFFPSFLVEKKKLLYSIFVVAGSVELNQSLQNHDLLSEENDVVGRLLEQLVGLDVSIVDRNEASKRLQLVGNLRARNSAFAQTSRAPPYSATEARVRSSRPPPPSEFGYTLAAHRPQTVPY